MCEDPLQNFSPFLEKCFGHSLELMDIFKNFRPFSENTLPPWYPKLVTALYAEKQKIRTRIQAIYHEILPMKVNMHKCLIAYLI